MRFFLAIALCTLLLASCTPIVKVLYGIKKPAIETRESTTRYLEKVGMESANNYALTERDYEIVASRIGLPAFYIFDTYANQIIIETDCGAVKTDFIRNLDRNIAYEIELESSLEDIITKLVCLDGNPADNIRGSEFDYYLVIYWAQFIGRVNKKSSAKWERAALENQNANISVIKVNMDFRDFWTK